MGVFNKTEEERKKREEQMRLKALIDDVNGSELSYESDKEFLVDYIEGIRKGNPNDFGDIDTLYRVITKMIDFSIFEEDDPRVDLYENNFEDIFLEAKKLFSRYVDPNSQDYYTTREYFIQDFLGPVGYIFLTASEENDELLFTDEAIYANFHEKKDFFEIVHQLLSDPDTTQKYNDLTIDYIGRVSKYCMTQDILKRDVLSFVAGLDEVVDDAYKEYSDECVEQAKKRIGIYNLSSRELANVDTKLRRVEGYLEQFDAYQTSIDDSKKAIVDLVENGKKDIRREAKSSVEQLKKEIEEYKQSLIEKLDAYLLELEELLKEKSDETFKQIIETYKSQVSEFRTLFKTYSMSASKDLLAIQAATQDSVRQLQAYVSNEPQLQELLRKAQEQNVVREKIIELVDKESQLLGTTEETPQQETVIVPGYGRPMIPYQRLILPSTISSKINPFLDESIPWQQRIEMLTERIEEREKQGIIFHKRVKDIAKDVMEGDWPYLWGPSGTGKSYLVSQVASLLDMEKLDAGKITEPYSILGYNDPQGLFRITPSFVAALYGNLLFFDEFDNGNPDTQIVLNPIYSQSLEKIKNPSEPFLVTFGTDVLVDVHPNFRMIAAGNTTGEGANEQCSSRCKIDESIQERFTPVFIDYDERVEKGILHDYPAWYNFFLNFRKICSDYARINSLGTPQGSASTRDADFLRKYIMHNSKTIDQIMCEKFVQTKNQEYRKALGKAMADFYDIDYLNCENPDFSEPLSEIKGKKEKILAQKFVYHCREGVK